MIARWIKIKIKIKIRMMSQIRKTKGARAPDWANSRAGFLAISVKKIRPGSHSRRFAVKNLAATAPN